MIHRTLLAWASAAMMAACCSSVQAAIAPNGLNYAFTQMQFVEISKIDGVEQAFHADFFMLTSWLVDVTNTNFTVNSDLLSETLTSTFWSPSLEFINARSDVTRLVEEPFAFSLDPTFVPANRIMRVANFTLDPTGNTLMDYALPPMLVENSPAGTEQWLWVQEDQRYQCDFTTPLRMQSFPYDQQFMQLQIESYWDASQVQIVWAEPAKISKLIPPTMPDIVGWTKKNAVFFGSDIKYQYNSRSYNRLTIRTLLERQPQYYLTKIVAGSMLLVYMGTWVFSLAVDEADRMMGSLTIFGGLITFLFVAAGDTPKVPYQTRLDVFMMFSFLCVATMLFVHGTLYYWRECDIEDHLEEQNEEAAEVDAPKVLDPDVELAAPGQTPAADSYASASAYGASSVRSVEPAARAAPAAPSNKWFLRVSETSDFSIPKWWRGLHLTRKCDAVIIPSLMIIYSVGVAIIFGRSVDVPNLLPTATSS